MAMSRAQIRRREAQRAAAAAKARAASEARESVLTESAADTHDKPEQAADWTLELILDRTDVIGSLRASAGRVMFELDHSILNRLKLPDGYQRQLAAQLTALFNIAGFNPEKEDWKP